MRRTKRWFKILGAVLVVAGVVYLAVPSSAPDDVAARSFRHHGAEVRRESATPELSAVLDAELFTTGKIWKVSFKKETITAEDVRLLGPLSKLKYLEFWWCTFADGEVLEGIFGLPGLDSLTFVACQLPPGARFQPGQLPALRSLDFIDSEFDPQLLLSARHLKGLRVVGLLGSRVPNDVLAELQARFPGVTIHGPNK